MTYKEANSGRWKCSFRRRRLCFQVGRKYLPPYNDKERATDTHAGIIHSE